MDQNQYNVIAKPNPKKETNLMNVTWSSLLQCFKCFWLVLKEVYLGKSLGNTLKKHRYIPKTSMSKTLIINIIMMWLCALGPFYSNKEGLLSTTHHIIILQIHRNLERNFGYWSSSTQKKWIEILSFTLKRNHECNNILFITFALLIKHFSFWLN